jgi:hypothetical protein
VLRQQVRLFVSLAFLLALIVPVTLMFTGNSSHCPLRVANAQDNPCLAQDATISALQVQVLSLQGTLASKDTNVGAQSELELTNNLIFAEDFSNNQNNWSLTQGVSIQGGELFMSEGGLVDIIGLNR